MLKFLLIIAILWITFSVLSKMFLALVLWARLSSNPNQKVTLKIGGVGIFFDITSLAYVVSYWAGWIR